MEIADGKSKAMPPALQVRYCLKMEVVIIVISTIDDVHQCWQLSQLRAADLLPDKYLQAHQLCCFV